MDKLFREKSLQKLTSPEQLDQLLNVVHPKGWILLVFLLFFTGAFLAWTAFGRLPVVVKGRSALYSPQDILLVRSSTTGVVMRQYVKPGQVVKRGDRLLDLDNPDLRLKQGELSTLIAFLEKEVDALAEFQGTSEELSNRKWQLASEKADLQLVEKQIQSFEIRAPDDGTVVRWEIDFNDPVASGEILLLLHSHRSSKQDAYFYGFVTLDAKNRLVPGMPVNIEVVGVPKGSFGFLKAKIKEELPFIASPKELLAKEIPSPALVDYLTQGFPALPVIIEPIVDPTTTSGYKWSIGKGPEYELPFGTLGSFSVVVEEKRPISYVIPFGEP